jgi:hypothetical protein
MWLQQLWQLLPIVCSPSVLGSSSILKLRPNDGKQLKTVDAFPVAEPLSARPGNVASG